VSRKQIMQGDIIPTLHSPFNFSHESLFSGSATTVSNAVNWLLVTRVDALNCVDEMIRVRGRYGPTVTKQMLSIVDNLPTVSRTGTGDYVDLELFLEVLITEFNAIRKQIKDLEVVGFCSNPIFQEPVQVRYLKQIINIMVEFDPRRTGLIDMETFRSILYQFYSKNPNFSHERVKVEELYELCAHHYKDESANGKICYVDFWVLVLAWIEQTVCSEAFTCLNLMEAVKTIQRGVDENVASTVIILLSYIQAPYTDGPLWTCSKVANDNKKSLLYQKGLWNVNTSVDFISEGPGQLMAKHVDAELATSSSLFEKSVEVVEQKSVEYTIPMILSTNRSLTTVYGEICKPVPSGKSKATIHFHDLSQELQSNELVSVPDKIDASQSLRVDPSHGSMPPRYFSKSLSSLDNKSVSRSFKTKDSDYR